MTFVLCNKKINSNNNKSIKKFFNSYNNKIKLKKIYVKYALIFYKFKMHYNRTDF